MKKLKFVSVLLCTVLMLCGAAFAAPVEAEETAEQSEEVVAQKNILVDEFNDFDKMLSHSDGMEIVNLDPKKFYSDTSGIGMAAMPKGTEFVYELPFDVGSYTLYLCGTVAEYSPDFKIYFSEDGINYTWDDYAEHRNFDGHRVYTNPEVTGNVRFVKIVYCSTQAPADLYLLKLEIREEKFVSVGKTRIKRTEPSDYDYESLPSLKEAYKDYFDIGAATEWPDILEVPNLLKTQYNHIGPENQAKFNGIHPQEANYEWYWTDRIYDWGFENGMTSGGLHALVYYTTTPKWMWQMPGGGKATKELVLKRYERHIKDIIAHYKGKVKYYDAVNELVDQGAYRSYMEEYKLFDTEDEFEDFLVKIFQWAHEADPEAKFIFLDGGMWDQDKRDLVWGEIIPRLIEKGLPKECLVLGEQLHFGINDAVWEKDSAICLEKSGKPANERTSIESILKTAKEMGLTVAFTEVDMGANAAMYASDLTDSVVGLTREELEEIAAKKYGSVFDCLREYSDIIEFVRFWGVTDNGCWRTQDDGVNALLWNHNFKPTKAFWRVLDFDKKLPRWTPDDFLETKRNDGWTLRTLKAVHGTPVIDGKLDAIWQKTEVGNLDVLKTGKEGDGATGTVRCLWDEENIYVFAEINDDIIDTSHKDAWYKDNVEIYIGEKNSKNGTYSLGDNQLRVTADGTLSGHGFGDWSLDCIDAKVQRTDKGYNVELVYHMQLQTNETGNILGFDTQITDHIDNSGVRRSMRSFCDLTHDSHTSSTLWGELELVQRYVNKGENAASSLYGFTSENAVEKTVKTESITFSISTLEESGTDYVLLRDLMSELGGSVRYDEQNNIIAATAYGKELKFKINDTNVFVNGEKTTVSAPMKFIENRIAVSFKDFMNLYGVNYETIKGDAQ